MTISVCVEENEKHEEEKNVCVLCYKNKPMCVSVPCGHTTFCQECMDDNERNIQNINKCPKCRGDVYFYQKVYY